MLRTRADTPLPGLDPEASAALAGAGGTTLPRTKPTLADRAYQQIRGMLLDGSLAPGVLVSEESLAKELGVSRTPVREAVRRLRAERLLEQSPRIGTTVRQPDPNELADLFDLREAMETFAASRLAAADLEPEHLSRLGELCRAMMVLARRLRAADRERDEAESAAVRGLYFAYDIAFHEELIRVTGNVPMLGLIRQNRVFTRILTRTRHESITDLEIARVYRHHRRILNAIRHGDASAARRRVADHLASSRANKGATPGIRPPVAAVQAAATPV